MIALDKTKDSKPPGLKLHVGCGTVYLEGFINIDVRREGFSFLASEKPDLVASRRTTFDRYYKDQVSKDTLLARREDPRVVVADSFQDITSLDYPPNSAEMIVCVQTLEHLTRDEVGRALENWCTILKPGGVLHIDVPDFEETARLLLAQGSEEEKDWYYRLIYGSQKDNFSIHKDGYSKEKLSRILSAHGFKNVTQMPNTRHFYPSIIIESTK
jgi:SAM-dependent methyltransferase